MSTKPRSSEFLRLWSVLGQRGQMLLVTRILPGDHWLQISFGHKLLAAAPVEDGFHGAASLTWSNDRFHFLS